ncbi:hypothetical protein CANCADRAFT_4172 [Tortispora caseinolytica NRRL Y-17796]|uniref:Mo25-like protein n=1 Tax=Tortispora caseinolytica NRRL Y-17796 TaxID=767744 RepID=A0A1E4TCW0_9ASCO|nr:hypothetical protein CANCADRAFT_4172 [Tortispora caseinolytica NRRL Y-17796]
MAFLFNRSGRNKTPHELIKQALESSQYLESDPRKGAEEVAKIIAQLDVMLFGEQDCEPNFQQQQQVYQELLNSSLMVILVYKLDHLDFDCRKDVVAIFSQLLHYKPSTIDDYCPGISYVLNNRSMLARLIKGPSMPSIALNCGTMLRECVKHEKLHKAVLDNPDWVWSLFTYARSPTFEISTDTFSTLRDLLLLHKPVVSKFLVDNQDKVFREFDTLMSSSSYLTKRQSVKLLSEIIIDRHNYTIMTAYIDDTERLKLIMNLLRDKSRNIQFEAFHVFKVFAANPKKTKPVLEILQKNRVRILQFLESFTIDRKNSQFEDEKSFVIRKIQQLPMPTSSATPAHSSSRKAHPQHSSSHSVPDPSSVPVKYS